MSQTLDGLPADVLELIAREGGVVDTRTARRAGISRTRLHNLAADGQLRRLATGIYAPAATADDKWGTFRLRARAFAAANRPEAFLTGWAAAAHWGLPTLGPPPVLPTAVRPKAPGRGPSRSASGRIVVATIPAQHLWVLDGVLVVSEAWAVVDLARKARLPDSLVVADAAVRRGTDLAGVLPHMRRWEGVGRAAWVAEQAVPTIESPLETLGRFTFIEHDLPMPVTNAWVGRDRPEWRLDGLLPWHWWGYEGDGAVKYDNRDDATRIVRAQQEREFQLRRLGLDLVRYGWPDAYPSREPLGAKVHAMFKDNPARSEPVKWWKDVPGSGPVEPKPEDWPSPHPAGLVLPAGWQHDLDRLRTGDQEAG